MLNSNKDNTELELGSNNGFLAQQLRTSLYSNSGFTLEAQQKEFSHGKRQL